MASRLPLVSLEPEENGPMKVHDHAETRVNGVNGTTEALVSPYGVSNHQEFDTVEDTIEAFKRGEFIIVLDSISRENEGDLIIAAEDVTPEKMAFMVQHTSGLVCTPISSTLTHRYKLPQMLSEGEATEIDGPAFTVTIDAVGTTTGVSAYDRAMTCKSLVAPESGVKSFRRPGHVFPLRARDGGIRVRAGHTEATLEFCRLARKQEVGVLCELVDVGSEVEGKTVRKGVGMLTRDGCLAFGRRWGIRVCTIELLMEHIESAKSFR